MAEMEVENVTTPSGSDAIEFSPPATDGALDVVARCDGQTKYNRLLFIADRCAGLRGRCYRMLTKELKKSINTELYVQIADSASAALGSEYFMDKPWVEATDRQSYQRLERLESELLAAKSTMVKESIRLAFSDIGDFHYERGNVSEALKAYLRTRDFCSIPRHKNEMCMNVITMAIMLGQYRHVNPYLSKIDETAADEIMKAKVKAAQALTALHDGNYLNAARAFLSVGGDLGGHFTHVLAVEEVAIYGSVCAIASLDRNEFRKLAIDNQSFKNFLEVVPEVRSLVNDFFTGNYGSCFRYLNKMKEVLSLDIYFHKHVEKLTSAIHEKCIVQYFKPYATADLTKMASALGIDYDETKKLVAGLISEGRLPARIDSETRTVQRKQVDDRSSAVKTVLKLAERQNVDAKRMLMRLSILRNNFSVTTKEAELEVNHNPGNPTVVPGVCPDGASEGAVSSLMLTPAGAGQGGGGESSRGRGSSGSHAIMGEDEANQEARRENPEAVEAIREESMDVDGLDEVEDYDRDDVY